MASRRPRTRFWTANDGKVYINLCHGTRVIEIAKDKSSIEVGEKQQLLPVTDALKQAVAAGEIDAQIDAAGVELSKKFLKFGR